MKDKKIYHASPSIIIELFASPMWFSFSRKISEGYYDFSDGELEYVHEYDLSGGKFLSIEETKKICESNGIEYDSMEDEIRDNPDELLDVEGIKDIMDICDGFVHRDFSPLENGKEIFTLLVFDPTKHLELVSITSTKDKEEAEDKEDEGIPTKAGVEMGKKTSISESFMSESIWNDAVVNKLNEAPIQAPAKGFKKDDIKNIFGSPEDVSWVKDCARIKALLLLYDFQTEDEQHTHSANVQNRMGFNGLDADILSSFAKQVISKYFLSDKQMTLLRKKIIKYAGQIAKVANEVKTNGKDQFVNNQFKKWVDHNIRRYKE